MSGSLWAGQELAGVLKELRPRCVVLHPTSFDWPYKKLNANDRAFRWPQLLALQDAPFVTRLTDILCRPVGEGFVSQPQWVVRRLADFEVKDDVEVGLLTILGLQHKVLWISVEMFCFVPPDPT